MSKRLVHRALVALSTTLALALFSAPLAAAEEPPAAPGVRMIPITTPKGTFHVWTQKLGDNPKVKVLVLHGGPGFSHDYLQALDRLVDAGFELYFYDQLGSGLSDRPDEPELWELPRFVDEVEQVRLALGLDRSDFYLYGQSWGGILGIEYALAHQEHLAGLIISNMMSSIPAYNEYAQKVLMPEMEPAVLEEVQQIEAAEDYENPRYMELLIPNHYEHHVLRKPFAEWPAPVLHAFDVFNPQVYIPMQGPSELGASGKLENWDRSRDLGRIEVPTLVIGARYDTMDPKHMEWMSKQLPKGRYADCPNGSHLALWDDADAYFEGLIGFLKDAEAGKL